MRLRENDPLDRQVERELEAIDAALRGDAVDHDLADLAELSTDLSGLRSTPEQPFAAELDARAAAGFGSGGRRETASAIVAGWRRFRSVPLSRQLMPVGAAALGTIVIATAVVAGRGGSTDESIRAASQPLSAPASTVGAGTDSVDSAPAPTRASAQRTGTQEDSVSAAPFTDQARAKSAPTGPFASDQNQRAIERDAQLTLGTDPEGVQGVSDDVLGIVGRYEGIVLNSSVSDGPAGDAGAQFELLIPSQRLGDALADLSGVAEVRSREENTKDITAPTVTTQEHLRDARAEVEGLLKQLANADTDEERRSAEGQLAFQRQRIAALRSTLSSLERRANLSHVSLDVVTGDASSFGATDDGRWTVGDALADAGHILGTAAAVTLIGLAILAPFALLALLIWLSRRGWVTQSRRRALEG